MDALVGSCIESKLKRKGWLSILRNISISSSKMTYNVLHPNMAFQLEFSLDQKIWHEVDILNDILKLELFKISKNLEIYELLKLAKKIMKWPIIFCILKAISIHFLTLYIKEWIKFKSARSLWKNSVLKVIKIDQVMIIWSHTWENEGSSGGLVIFLHHQVSSTWKLLETFEVIC